MQNESTLINLGFHKILENKWEKQGKFQKFIAVVEVNNPPVYISLYMESQKIDTRKHSPYLGKKLNCRIKDCCSNDSVSKALSKYDLPDDNIKYTTSGVIIEFVKPEKI